MTSITYPQTAEREDLRAAAALAALRTLPAADRRRARVYNLRSDSETVNRDGDVIGHTYEATITAARPAPGGGYNVIGRVWVFAARDDQWAINERRCSAQEIARITS